MTFTNAEAIHSQSICTRFVSEIEICCISNRTPKEIPIQTMPATMPTSVPCLAMPKIGMVIRFFSIERKAIVKAASTERGISSAKNRQVSGVEPGMLTTLATMTQPTKNTTTFRIVAMMRLILFRRSLVIGNTPPNCNGNKTSVVLSRISKDTICHSNFLPQNIKTSNNAQLALSAQ